MRRNRILKTLKRVFGYKTIDEACFMKIKLENQIEKIVGKKIKNISYDDVRKYKIWELYAEFLTLCSILGEE